MLTLGFIPRHSVSCTNQPQHTSGRWEETPFIRPWPFDLSSSLSTAAVNAKGEDSAKRAPHQEIGQECGVGERTRSPSHSRGDIPPPKKNPGFKVFTQSGCRQKF